MRGSVSRTLRRRKASSTMLRRRVWSGSSMVSMLTASARTQPGIHQRKPATLPSLRIVNVSLSFRTRPAISLLVVIQVLPMMGKRTFTTDPAARSSASRWAGSRRYSWLVTSKRSIVCPPSRLIWPLVQLQRQDERELGAACSHDLWQAPLPIQRRLRLQLTGVSVHSSCRLDLDTHGRSVGLAAQLSGLGLGSGLRDLGACGALSPGELRVGLALGLDDNSFCLNLGALAVLLRLHALRTGERGAVHRLLVLIGEI